MTARPLRIVVFGLSLSSSWGNGHATTYRALLRAFRRRGHSVLFLERDQPWYRGNRDMPKPDFCRLELYRDVMALDLYREQVATADAVIVGSYVPEGVVVGGWVQRTARGVTAFYDIDTPVTLAKLERGDYEYLTPELIPGYDLYLSFTGGPTLTKLMRRYGAPRAEALYCSADPEAYRPVGSKRQYDLGYLGTYSPDRQPTVERLLIEPARRAPHLNFVVAGPMYPQDIAWPENVERIAHVPPKDHARFYSSCRFTLNVTREDMIRAGYSPSVRLFEAAACAAPVISDSWPGLTTLFTPGHEIMLAKKPEDVVTLLTEWPEDKRRALGLAAQAKVLEKHTAEHRAEELETYLRAAMAPQPAPVDEVTAPAKAGKRRHPTRETAALQRAGS